jgi:protein-tyrosine-phosphatase
MILTEPPLVAVLFVDVGNTCRSVFAEYLARYHASQRLMRAARIESAGLVPQPPIDATGAIDTLRYVFGINASTHIPRSVHLLKSCAFDLIVAIDDPGRQTVRRQVTDMKIGSGHVDLWNVHDPFGAGPWEYEECALAVLHELSKWRRANRL